MKKLLLIITFSFLLSENSHGMFKRLNIPLSLYKLQTRNCTPQEFLKLKKINDITQTVPKDLQILTNLFNQNIKKIETKLDRLQEKIATKDDLRNYLKKDDNE